MYVKTEDLKRGDFIIKITSDTCNTYHSDFITNITKLNFDGGWEIETINFTRNCRWNCVLLKHDKIEILRT